MKVIKRNGKTDDFQVVKVKKAIEKAFRATETSFSEDMLDILSLRVTADFQEKVAHGKIDIEEIQTSMEKNEPREKKCIDFRSEQKYNMIKIWRRHTDG